MIKVLCMPLCQLNVSDFTGSFRHGCWAHMLVTFHLLFPQRAQCLRSVLWALGRSGSQPRMLLLPRFTPLLPLHQSPPLERGTDLPKTVPAHRKCLPFQIPKKYAICKKALSTVIGRSKALSEMGHGNISSWLLFSPHSHNHCQNAVRMHCVCVLSACPSNMCFCSLMIASN